jgi:asparagine synthase (glutamine-hydrolysing)
VACSTPTAIAWDASFRANADPSGRSVRGVHDAAV